jgi:hypothetical protein
MWISSWWSRTNKMKYVKKFDSLLFEPNMTELSSQAYITLKKASLYSTKRSKVNFHGVVSLIKKS